jgi:hypothetical protein
VKTVDLDPEPETPYRVAARVTPDAWPLPDLKDIPAKKTRDGRAASVHEVLRSTAVDWSGLPYPVTRIDMALSYDDPDVVEETRVAFDPQAIATTETADPDQVATALTLRALRQRQLQPWPLAPFIPDDAILARSWQPHSGYYLMFALDRMPLPNEIAQRPDLARRAAALVEQWAMGEVVPTIDDVVGFAIMPQSGGLNETPPPAIQWLVPSLQPEKTREELTDGLQRQMQRITGASSLTLPGRTPLLKTIEQDGMVQVVLGAREVGVEPTRRPGLAMIGDWLVLTTSEASLAEANQRRKKQQPRLLDNPDSVTRLLGRPAHHHLFFQCPRDLPQLYRHYETFLKDSPQQVQRGSDKRDQAVRDALQILSLVDRMARTSTYTSDDAVMMKARWRMAK